MEKNNISLVEIGLTINLNDGVKGLAPCGGLGATPPRFLMDLKH